MKEKRIRLVLLAISMLAISFEAGAPQRPDKEPPRDPATGRYQYQEVVEVGGASAAELYSRAKAWVASAYRSANDVVQLDDPQSLRLILKGTFHVAYMGLDSAFVRHVVTIEAKDGRYRYTISDLGFNGGAWSDDVPLEEAAIRTGMRKQPGRAADECEGLIAGLKAAMATPTPAADQKW